MNEDFHKKKLVDTDSFILLTFIVNSKNKIIMKRFKTFASRK